MHKGYNMDFRKWSKE